MMHNKNEINIFIQEFKKCFNQLKEKKIVLYGIGIKSEIIIKKSGFNIIGLMDKNPKNIGKIIYGLPVIDIDTLLKNADLIIIASSNIYFQIIFSRISFLKLKYNIPIFFCNGEEAKLHFNDKKLEDNKYWDCSLELLKKEIDKHDVISFDIYDTLITRKLAEPIDLLYIIQKELSFNNFVEKRLKAEIQLGNKAKLCDIYTILSQEYYKAFKLEEELEIELTIPRKDIIEAFNYAKEQNKEIFLITDIYHSKEFIKKLLMKFNIFGYKDVFVSCELEKRKSDNTLWKYYKEIIKDKKALHIGDNIESDIYNAQKIGLSTYHILSPFSLLEVSSLASLKPKICSLDESLIVGQIVSKIFNSPFCLNKSKGKIIIKTFYEIGYVFYGAIIFNYLVWVIKKSLSNKNDLALFVSRDGYFLKKLYELIKSHYNIECANSKYLMASRILMTIINLKDRQDIDEALNIKFEGSIKNYFFIRFGIKVDDNNYINFKEDYDKIKIIIDNNEKDILNNATIQRSRYIQYLKKLIDDKNDVFIVEPSFKGTIQFNLSKLLDLKINGYYCNADLSKDNNYYKNNMYALFQKKNDLKAQKSKLREHTLFFEDGFLVAPHGTCFSINNDLSFNYYPPGLTQKNFSDKENIFLGVLDFFYDMFSCYKTFDNIEINSNFIDEFIGEVYSEKIEILQELKDKFYYDTLFEKIVEEKIFD